MIPKEITPENYFRLLGALSRLPGTRMPFSAHPHPTIEGGPGVVAWKRGSGSIVADIRFPDAARLADPEARNARVFIDLPAPIDLSNAVLMARAQVYGNLVMKGGSFSRIKFELYDVNGRTLLGPNVRVTGVGKDIPLIVRPTLSSPIPTGFADPQFDLSRVKRIVVRFMIGQSLGAGRAQANAPFRGSLLIDQMIVVHDLDLIKKFFPVPDARRVTENKINLGYELRKRKWRMEKEDFFVGVNYPWRNYGWDFGKNPWRNDPLRDGWAMHEDELTRNFARLRAAGVTYVRFFVFCDARTGFVVTPKGYAIGPYVLEDTEAILRAASKTNMKLIPVLFDFGIGNTEGNEYDAPGHPELVFSPKKYAFLTEAVLPFLRKLDALNDRYGRPIAYLDLMNEPDNMALLVVPGYYRALKAWLEDLAVIVHEETSMKVTLGARSFADFRRWWSGMDIDAYQFHFYENMAIEMPPIATDVPKKTLGIDEPVFCGELDPNGMAINIPRLKEQGYDGVLVWSYKAGDGFGVDLDNLRKTVEALKEEPKKKAGEK